jgi:hypothetical protein
MKQMSYTSRSIEQREGADMETHVKVLGVLFVALGVLGLIGVVVIALVFGGAAGIVSVAAEDPETTAIAVPVLGTVGTALGGLILILSLPDILVGIGLLERRSWARILGIVLSLIGLLNFPIGTVVGVYGLWVLLSPSSEALFQGAPPVSRT